MGDKWRYQVVQEISKKIGNIQNHGLGEHKIRKENDEINRLIREKGHWEQRILELGGPNYSALTKNMESRENHANMYRYFGAARNLPIVKELFESNRIQINRKKKYQ